MAVKRIRALINAASFPFTYGHTGRSVTEIQDLNARMPSAFFGSPENAEFGVPQIIYAENVLPFAKGIFSVGFAQQAAAASPAYEYFDQAIVLRDASENLNLMVPAGGQNYIYHHDTGLWDTHSTFAFAHDLVTWANVNGRTFVCYEKEKILEYDPNTNTFSNVAITYPSGFSIANVRGIGGAQNYLLFFTDIEIYWSSALDITNFADLDHGAGNQTPTDLKGKITCILPLPGGFIAYTARNAVGATFTNVAASPFAFKEVDNSGGVPSRERVASDANESGHYAWTSNGLQKLTLKRADPFAPDVTDFLVGNIWEQWNSTTKEVEQSEIGSAFSVKMNYVAGRYVVISYGQERNGFNAALVFDVALGRWGKLLIDHCDVFMYPYPTMDGDFFYDDLVGTYNSLGENTYNDLDVVRLQVTTPKQGIAFLTRTGEIYILTLDFTQSTNSGVAIFGHFQETRNNKITAQWIETEGLKDSGTPTVSLLVSNDGTDRTYAVTIPLTSSTAKFKQYNCRNTGENFDIAIEGSFVLTGLLMGVTRHGAR